MKLLTSKCVVFACSAILSSELYAARLAGELIELPLEELMMLNISVSSASKREQGYFDTPAPVSVITAEQIEKSGFTSIPKALRTMPGVQVGGMQTAGWSVSIRGFGGRFSRYLVILVDGRSVYDGLLNGVNWDEVNINMSNIEKIELVRGPSGMFWGANAVNGVINIITKNPKDIVNNSVELGAGNIQKEYMTAQFGHRINDDTYLKVNANYIKRKGLEYIDLDAAEGEQNGKRLNLALKHYYNAHQFDVTANVFATHNNELWQDTRISSVLTKGNRGYFNMDQDKNGYNLQGKWRYQLSSEQNILTRLSFDHVDRSSSLYDSTVENIDLDVEYNTQFKNHVLTLGSNNRYSNSDYHENNGFVFLLNDDEFSNHTNSIFINDTLYLGDDFELSLGGRYEDDSTSGTHSQWGARALWRIDDNRRLWSAYSRSNSTPSRLLIDGDNVDYLALPALRLVDLDIDLSLLPSQYQNILLQNQARLFQPVSVILRGYTQGDHENVVVDAFELGYRSVINDNFIFDISAYYNEYENLITPEVNVPGLLGATISYVTGALPLIVAPIWYNDSGTKKSAGLELSLIYKVSDALSIQYSGDYFNSFDEDSDASGNLNIPVISAELDSPAFTHRLNLSYDFSDKLSSNVLLRYVDSVSASNIEAYAVADIAVHYQATPHLGLSLITRNLGDPHPETYSEGFTVGLGEHEPSMLFKLNYQWGGIR